MTRYSGRSEPLDLRLAVGAVAGWLAVIAGLRGSAGAAAWAGIAALAAGFAACLIARPVARSLALVAFVCALLLLPLAARLAALHGSPLVALAERGARGTVTMTITEDPRLLGATGPAGASRVAVVGSAAAVRTGGGAVTAPGTVLVLANASDWLGLLPGQRVEVAGRLRRPLGGDLLAAVLVPDGPPELIGRPPWWQRSAGSVRDGLREAAAPLPPGPRGLLPALVAGDTAGIDPVTRDRFQQAGMTHLLAVSGTNCAIVVGAVLLVLRRMRAPPLVCAIGSALVLLEFVVVARPSPSVLRAAAMVGVALVAIACGRPRIGVPCLAGCVIGLLMSSPYLAVDAGFAMSVLATGALLLIAPGWADALRARGVPPVVAESLAVAAAAHLVTAPVVAAIAGHVSLVAVPANVLAEPVVAVATIFGFAAAAAGPFVAPVAALLAWIAGWPCRWLVGVADVFGSVDGATLPWPGGVPGGLLLLAASVLVWRLACRPQARLGLLVVAVVFAAAHFPVRSLATAWPPPGWAVVACDVGQGDAIVLSAGPGAAVVVDAGPDPVTVDECLRGLGVRHVPLLMVTHFHMDHVAGLVGVLRDREVGLVLTAPAIGDADAAGARVAAVALQQHALTARVPAAGESLAVGQVRLEVLGPHLAYRGTRSDPNNTSLVVRAEVGGIRVLLTGDVEVEAQADFLSAGIDVTADVLKVPHHGSAYNDERFLGAVQAKVALVSAGTGNDYGHPAPSLLTMLARLGLPVARTDLAGDIAVGGRPGRLRVSTHDDIGRHAAVGAASAPRATMCACPPVPVSRPAPPPRELPRRLPWYSSSGTRNTSCPAASARSPPNCGRSPLPPS